VTRVAWLATEPLERTPRGYTSERASLRYRMALPSAALQGLGCDSSIRHFTPGAMRGLLQQLGGMDVVVVGKIWYPPETLPRTVPPLLSMIEGLRRRRVKVVADFCDDYFSDPQRGPFDIGLANSVDAVIASTPQLGDTLRQLTPAPVTVVSDPVEGARGEARAPRAGANAPLSLLWFGHAVNFPALLAGLRQMEHAAREVPFSLVAVSSPGAYKEGSVAELNEAWRAQGRACTFRVWSVRAVFDALNECDAVIIPSDSGDPRKSAKSPNRFAESVWAGRCVLAHPLPAYLPFADAGWVGEDLAAGLRWLAGRPDEAIARVRRGQELVAREYSPEAIGGAWRRALEAA
jgi:hypothetical protein